MRVSLNLELFFFNETCLYSSVLGQEVVDVIRNHNNIVVMLGDSKMIISCKMQNKSVALMCR